MDTSTPGQTADGGGTALSAADPASPEATALANALAIAPDLIPGEATAAVSPYREAAPEAPAEPTEATPQAPPEPFQTVEEWAAQKQTEAIWFKSAFVREGWCEGLRVSEFYFDKAIADAKGEVSR